MLLSTSRFISLTIGATDGVIGTVNDLLFDSRDWMVRYLVADTGTWMHGRLVLISPTALGIPDSAEKSIPVHLTREEVRNSPPIEADEPVSRRKEAELARYYGWPLYWSPSMTAVGLSMPAGPWPEEPESSEPSSAEEGNPNLRSVREVIGYNVEASDGGVGHVDDFVVSTDHWAIQYVVIDTRNWLPARKVMLLPMWVSNINWELRQVEFNLPKEAIRSGPEYQSSTPVNRTEETHLYDYYGRPCGRV
jgi:hypothetical protein